MAEQKDFEAAIHHVISQTLKDTSYRPSYFIQMVADRGAYDASLSLIRASKPSDGFTKLWELKRLDLTVEAVAVRPEFANLFTSDDIKVSNRRLAQYGYSSGGI